MKTLLRVLHILLWVVTGFAVCAIAVCNYLPRDWPPALSPALSYGFLASLGLALLVGVIRHRENNHSDTGFYLKIGGCLLFLVWTAVTVVDAALGGKFGL